MSLPHRACVFSIVVSSLAATASAGAQTAAESEAAREEAGEDVVPDARGFELGLRLGWAIPQGETVRGKDLAKTVHGAVPFWLDVGYRVAPPLVVGLYAQYAYVIVSGCATSCHSSDVRFGVQVQWHFGERGSADHWIGLGLGYELLSEEFEDTAGDTHEGVLSGIEFVNLQFGEDLPLGHGFSLGPFVSASLGKFLLDSRLQSPGLAPSDDEIPNRSFHVWVVLGARLAFGT
jgi:hypothetical protein